MRRGVRGGGAGLRKGVVGETEKTERGREGGVQEAEDVKWMKVCVVYLIYLSQQMYLCMYVFKDKNRIKFAYMHALQETAMVGRRPIRCISR